MALELLASSDAPIGSARLMEELAEPIGVAETTAGRYLRQLDQRG